MNYIEGTDLIGKSTIVSALNNPLVKDRYLPFTQLIETDGSLKSDYDIIEVLNNLNKEDKIFVLYLENTDILLERLEKRRRESTVDSFDENCVLYNSSYLKLLDKCIEDTRIIAICIDGLNLEEILYLIKEDLYV